MGIAVHSLLLPHPFNSQKMKPISGIHKSKVGIKYMDTDALSLFQHNLDCPFMGMTNLERNKGIRTKTSNWTEEIGSTEKCN